ncbi:MAG: exodeoxyribonuclease VII large subunit, partial [Oscillospiraceae bacterium]|nr:exodeoxyribonuclease VII large subunit [Oscillospiraceae bacterium]
MKQGSVLTVTQLNQYVKFLLEGDSNLGCVYVTGEISNFTDHYRSGHLYFSLKDDRCTLKAVMFASAACHLRFHPENGMKVLVRGRVSAYEVSGQYQLYAEEMQPVGAGERAVALEQLKEKLRREGLFDAQRKRKLPRYPMRIGVVTSATGAVIHDIQNVLSRRWPIAQILLCPVAVQGAEAVPQIVNALQTFNAKMCADVLIIGRGGGSAEDLWAFNEEPVVRAVAASEIPVISAVGHETDVTLTDFAA